MKNAKFLSLLMVMCSMFLCANAQEKLQVDLSGNGYVTKGFDGARITGKGLQGWTDKQSVVSVYFYLREPSQIKLSLLAQGDSKILVECNGKKRIVRLSCSERQEVSVGSFNIKKAGYVKVNLQGITKRSQTYGEVSTLIVEGAKGEVRYVKDFADYWGRRGPSVHMAYRLPESDTEWFYNEVTVPKEGEIMHSYYMAAGFGEGYFGMQYNSDTERRVLFSVWSPFDTQDPRQIPEEDRIRLMRRGTDVYIGEFGNEGSGGQSFLRYNWKAGTTYPFLMRVKPDGQGNTEYTAFFYATDEAKWRLIASFIRPKTNTWYTHAHSFLENFSPEQGYLTRKCLYGNQWARDAQGKWHRVTDGAFTYDATAGAGVRLDYQGGKADDDTFYLKMGGFFNESTAFQTIFKRAERGEAPQINFKELEQLYLNSAEK